VLLTVVGVQYKAKYEEKVDLFPTKATMRNKFACYLTIVEA
jgi:hypothetical protein